MAQTRRQHPSPHVGKKKRSRSRLVHPATGEVAILRVGKYEIELPVSDVVMKVIGKRKKRTVLGKLLAGYADVAEKAARAGRAVEYTVRVTPEGDAEPVAKPDPLDAALSAAKKRGEAKVAEILKGDDMLTASDFGSLIGASHETVNVKRRRGEVLGLQAATRAVRYPAWQVTDAGQLLPGLSSLFEMLGQQPWTVYRFLRTAHPELEGRTALDALKAGEEKAVLNVARNQMSGVFS
ncbi:hypothetical protein P0R31_33950 [Bradyrhizobium yuanmingense]|uniref:hypothetical protein n=1 Tax=Bradyrhizobium yuanmingense TaxID=108015 RepID=UPI0023B8F91B|nr:hypothetical protein [Bradyrhizobium yuanmingense]MDF0522246.1 hypothetical protein [Bradyrhizobium yuanmingense]